MNIRMGIRNKLLLATLGIVGPMLVITVALIISRFKEQSQKDAEALGGGQVGLMAGYISELLNSAMGNVVTLSALVANANPEDVESRVPLLDSALRWTLEQNANIVSTWTVIDRRFMDIESTTYDGEVAIRYGWAPEGGIRRDTTLRSAGFSQSSIYARYRDRNRDAFRGPYLARNGGKNEFVISICTPLRDRLQQAIGLVGVEISLTVFETQMASFLPYANAFALLVSPNMRIMGATKRIELGRGIEETALGIPGLYSLLPPLRQGESIKTTFTNAISGERSYLFTSPIRVGNDSERINLLYIIPRASLLGFADRTVTMGYMVSGVGLLLLIILLVWIANRIGRGLRSASTSLQGLSEGRIDHSLALNIQTKDELGAISEATNRLLASIERKVEFAEAIGAGNMDSEYEGGEEDVLGKSLKRMQESLRDAEAREELQRAYEKQQAWATEGLARFSEVLRYDAQDIKSFAYHVIRHLAQYSGADIGALYIRNHSEEEGEYYTLEAAYAYEVRKYVEAKIFPREGLVGRCVTERSRIYFTDVPQDYVRITSGLGEHKPDALLLIPAMMNESMEGVIELARFGGFEEYVIRFVESVAGSLAATLVTLQNHLQNQSLLEEAKRQGSELKKKMEILDETEVELQHVKLQLLQQEEEYKSLQNAVRNSCSVVEYTLKGEIVYANSEYLNIMGLSLEEILGRKHFENLVMSSEQAAEYQHFWSDLQEGITKRNILSRIEYNGRLHSFLETYSPLYHDSGELYRIIKIAMDITEYVNEEGTAGIDFGRGRNQSGR